MALRSVKSDASGRRQHGLDLVRAAAIAWVMIYHANTMALIPGHGPGLASFGWMGVDLFFVLSGFLIASQLLKPWAIGSRPKYSHFVLRRALRTLPAFFVVLLLYFALPQLREAQDIQPFWQFLTFTENLLFDPSSPKAFDHVWSLCVEEQFYLIFPLVVAALAIAPSARKTATILLVTIIAGIALRSFLWSAYVAQVPFSPAAESDWHAYVSLIYYPTWSRLDGLIAGVAIAILKIFRPNAWERLVAQPNMVVALGLTGIAAAIMLFTGKFGLLIASAIGFPLLSLSVALVVAGASTGRSLLGRYRVLGGEALATIAYSLYLTHKIAFHATLTWIAPALGASGYAKFLLAIVTALIMGAALYWLIERPFLQLRDRLDKRPSIVGIQVRRRLIAPATAEACLLLLRARRRSGGSYSPPLLQTSEMTIPVD